MHICQLFFSAVKGKTPQVGDRVLVEAVYNPNMPFKWNAQRIQTLPQLPNQSVWTFSVCSLVLTKSTTHLQLYSFHVWSIFLFHSFSLLCFHPSASAATSAFTSSFPTARRPLQWTRDAAALLRHALHSRQQTKCNHLAHNHNPAMRIMLK